jgi:flagellar biosynthesis protein FliQ
MSRNNFLSKFLSFIGWLTGVIVSLAVAFGMIEGVLTIKFIPQVVMIIFGWIVILTTLLGAMMSIMKLLLTRHSR